MIAQLDKKSYKSNCKSIFTQKKESTSLRKSFVPNHGTYVRKFGTAVPWFGMYVP